MGKRNIELTDFDDYSKFCDTEGFFKRHCEKPFTIVANVEVIQHQGYGKYAIIYPTEMSLNLLLLGNIPYKPERVAILISPNNPHTATGNFNIEVVRWKNHPPTWVRVDNIEQYAQIRVNDPTPEHPQRSVLKDLVLHTPILPEFMAIKFEVKKV